MNLHTFSIALCLMILPASQLMAANEVPPPPVPDELERGSSESMPEPEVTIVHRKDAVIEEVRIGGQLRYAKITPSSGPAYYMVDTDGDGLLDTRNDNLDNPPINRWILLRW